MMNIWKTAKRAYNRFYSQAVVKKNEKEFLAKDGETSLRYMLFKKPSDALIVGFASRDARGPVYHYVHTLACTSASRLYIKDDYAQNGTFYLGRHQTNDIEEACFELIDKAAKQCGAKKLYFIGSSKGGYAAINFGIEYPNSTMVVAAPSYYVGSILRDRKGYVDAVKLVMDEPITPEKVERVDKHLYNKIQKNPYANTQRLFIHYSPKEPYYEQHVHDLLRDLRESGVEISEDLGSYTEHEDLKFYYPDYVTKVILGEEGRP